jgi:hypothetical protein
MKWVKPILKMTGWIPDSNKRQFCGPSWHPILRVVAAVTPLQQQGDSSLCMYMHVYIYICECECIFILLHVSTNNMCIHIHIWCIESQIETFKQKMLQWSFRTKQRLAGTYVHLEKSDWGANLLDSRTIFVPTAKVLI